MAFTVGIAYNLYCVLSPAGPLMGGLERRVNNLSPWFAAPIEWINDPIVKKATQDWWVIIRDGLGI